MDVWEVPCSSCSGLDRGFLMDVGPKRLFRQGTKPTCSYPFGRASVVHPVEQVANRLHHGVWAVDVECGVRSVSQHAVFTLGDRIGNGPVDCQLDVVQLMLRGFGREHRRNGSMLMPVSTINGTSGMSPPRRISSQMLSKFLASFSPTRHDLRWYSKSKSRTGAGQ